MCSTNYTSSTVNNLARLVLPTQTTPWLLRHCVPRRSLWPGNVHSSRTQTLPQFAALLPTPCPSCWPLIQSLQQLKKQADPNNRLHALRWAQLAQHTGEWVQHPRPDLAPYQQHLYGFEAVHAVLNLSPQRFNTLLENGNRLEQVLHEVARTYCRNFSAEIELLQHLLPYIQQGHLSAHLVYEQATAQAKPQQPKVLGLEYLHGEPYRTILPNNR